jgi:hypothetical protein
MAARCRTEARATVDRATDAAQRIERAESALLDRAEEVANGSAAR